MRLALLLALALPLAACADDAPEVEAPPVEAPAAPAPAVAVEKVNLNTATEGDFLAIPDVGDRMAHEFDEYRPYASIVDFRREIGKYVDEAQVAAYEEYVFVPIDVDAADAETLRQLPGVGAAESVRLVGGQPYGSAEAFLDAYAEAVPGGDRDAAARFLAE